jgi:hypothetical protein
MIQCSKYLALVGIPGNILVISVFALKHKSSIRRTILIILAIYDLLVCGVTLPFEFYDLYNQYAFREKWVCKIFRTLNHLFVFNSSAIMQLMTVERYRRVCRAMKRQMSQRMISFLFLVSKLFKNLKCLCISCTINAYRIAINNILHIQIRKRPPLYAAGI